MFDFDNNSGGGGGDDGHDDSAKRAAMVMVDAAFEKAFELNTCPSCTLKYFIRLAIASSYCALVDQLKDDKYQAQMEFMVIMEAMSGVDIAKDNIEDLREPPNSRPN